MTWFMAEYECECGERFESLERRDSIPDSAPCPECGEASGRTISAGHSMTVWGTAVNRGKSDRPPHSLAMDAVGVVGETRTEHEWSDARKAKWRAYDRARRRKLGAPI